MSPSKGYKTYNKFHNYHMKRKFISDSSHHMLKPQTNRKLRYYRIFLPILLRDTRIGDVIHGLGHLNFSKYDSALCHDLIYKIEIFHFINRKTWVIFLSHVLHLLSEISLFHKYRIWNEFSFHTVFIKRVVCFLSKARGYKTHKSFINTVWNENSFQILFITW